MKYCSKCGNQLFDESVVCPKCGCLADGSANGTGYANQGETSQLKTAAKVLMIIGTILLGLYIIPLAWCLPLTMMYCDKIKNNQPIGVGFKVCCLLFVNTVAGVLMLCDKD